MEGMSGISTGVESNGVSNSIGNSMNNISRIDNISKTKIKRKKKNNKIIDYLKEHIELSINYQKIKL